jgi:hypothetical protein
MIEITTTHITAGLILICGILGIIFIPWIVGRQVMKWAIGFYPEDTASSWLMGILLLFVGTLISMGLILGYTAIYTTINN